MKGALCITPEFLDREVKGEESKVTKEIEGGKQNGRIKKKKGNRTVCDEVIIF